MSQEDRLTWGELWRAVGIMVAGLLVVYVLAWLDWEYDGGKQRAKRNSAPDGGIGVWLGGFDEDGKPEY